MKRKLRELEVWIASSGGTIVGWGAIKGDRLEGLYTDPGFAGRGIGTSLEVSDDELPPEIQSLFFRTAQVGNPGTAGTYKLVVEQRKIVETGETVSVPNPLGYITYGKDGRMMALIVRHPRPKPESPDA